MWVEAVQVEAVPEQGGGTGGASTRSPGPNREVEGLTYQPVVDLQTGQLVGVEVSPPRRGDGDAGRVLREVTEQLGRWNREFPDAGLLVSLDVSDLQLGRDDLLTVVEALAQEGVDPARLVLEVSEDTLVPRGGGPQVLQAAQGSGVVVGVSDFGTGHSSLRWIQSDPVSRLTLDRSLVARIGRCWDEVPAVDSALALAHTLGLTSAAEGVDTPEQLAYLRRRGCQQGQGAALAGQVGAEEVSELLALGADAPWRVSLGEDEGCYHPHAETVSVHEAAFNAEDVESFVRALLGELQRITGLTTTYLTRISADGAVQHVDFTNHTLGAVLRAGASVEWSESLCRRALERSVRRTSDAVAAFPDTDIAAEIGITSYLVEPVYDEEGRLYGTLCGAARSEVPLDEGDSAAVRLFARLVAEKLRRTAVAGGEPWSGTGTPAAGGPGPTEREAGAAGSG